MVGERGGPAGMWRLEGGKSRAPGKLKRLKRSGCVVNDGNRQEAATEYVRHR